MDTNNNFPPGFTLGKFSIYKMQGVDRWIYRAKTGPSKNTIKLGPQYVFLRQNMSEFGGAAKAASRVISCCYGIKHLADSNFSGPLSRLCKIILKQDSGLSGQRAVKFSMYGKLIEGFNFNKNAPFESVLKQLPSVQFSPAEARVSVSFPDIYPLVTLANPWKLAYYRFRISFGWAPDLEFTERGYAPSNPLLTPGPQQATTDWISFPDQIKGFTMDLGLAKDPPVNSGARMLAVGIEFGKAISDSRIQAVKYCGSAKILAVG